MNSLERDPEITIVDYTVENPEDKLKKMRQASIEQFKSKILTMKQEQRNKISSMLLSFKKDNDIKRS